MNGSFGISFEPETLRMFTRMENWQGILGPQLGKASSEAGDAIIATIPTVTDWINGTGTLDSSFYKAESTPYQAIVRSDLPYAHRRNYGFKGPDRRGIMFPNDPAAHYAEKTLEAASPKIEDIYYDAGHYAVDILGGRL